MKSIRTGRHIAIELADSVQNAINSLRDRDLKLLWKYVDCATNANCDWLIYEMREAILMLAADILATRQARDAARKKPKGKAKS